MAEYHRERYAADNLCLIVAGRMEPSKVIKLVEQQCGSLLPSGTKGGRRKPAFHRGTAVQRIERFNQQALAMVFGWIFVIMAFLGGMQRLWGPVLGVIPLVVLSELLQVQFPYWFSILLGLVFMAIVYVLPRGVTGLVEDGWALLARRRTLPRGSIGSLVEVVSRLFRPLVPSRGISERLATAWGRLKRRQGA